MYQVTQFVYCQCVTISQLLAGYWRNGWLAGHGVFCLSVICQACVHVCLSADSLAYGFKRKKASVMISSLSESLNILVSTNVWFITKFERGHPERGRLLRLGWVRTGDFCNFFDQQDKVRTNTESVQCHHVFDTAYVAPLYEVTGRHRLRDQSIRHKPIPTGGPLELILNLLTF